MNEFEFLVIEWRAHPQGDSLKGFATFKLPSGMIVHDCAFHQREGGQRWLAMPSRTYTREDGSTAWQPVIDFVNSATSQRFQKLAKDALDLYFKLHPPSVEADPTVITDDDEDWAASTTAVKTK
jgi:hypothetical protein